MMKTARFTRWLMQHSWFFGMVAVAMVVICLRFSPAVFQGKTLVFGDNYSLMVPGKIFTATWLKQGVLPLWNPLIFSGLPWLADINQSVLYFTTAFFVWFHPAVALNLTITSHWLIAFVGAYLLGRFWTKQHWLGMVAGSLWMLSTQVTGSSNNFSTLQSIVWLPLIAFFGLQLRSRWWAIAGFALTILAEFLGGYPQHVLYAIMAAVWLSIIWEFGPSAPWQSLTKLRPEIEQWVKMWAVAGVMTVGLSAVAWLPFVETLQQSTRMTQTSEQAAVGSLDPVMLVVKPLLPYAFDKPTAGMKWGPAWSGQPNVVFYFTWIGILALVTRFIWFRKKIDHWFFWPIAITLTFSLGSNLPGFAQLQQALPFLRIARYPSMVMIATQLWLIAWLLEVWSDKQMIKKLWQHSWRWLGVAGIFGGVFWLLSVWQFAPIWSFVDQVLQGKLSHSVFHTLARDQVIATVIGQNIFMAAGLSLLAGWLLSRQRWAWFWAVMTLDLLYATQSMLFFAPAEIYSYPENKLLEQLQATSGWQHRSLTRNVNMPYSDYGSYWEAMVVRSPFSDSFVTPVELQQFAHLQHLRNGATPDWNLASQTPMVHGYTTLLPRDYDQLWRTSVEPRINFIAQVDPSNALLAEWAVKYYLVDTAYKVTESVAHLPIVATDQQWQLHEIPKALSRIRFLDGTPVKLDGAIETPNSIELTFVNASSSASLIVADRYDSAWKAEVNQQPVVIANYRGMRQIAIQPGKNQVKLQYQPHSIWWGLGITLATATSFLAVTTFVCLTNRKRFVTI